MIKLLLEQEERIIISGLFYNQYFESSKIYTKALRGRKKEVITVTVVSKMPSMELSLSILLYLVHVVVDCSVGPKLNSPLPYKRLIWPSLLPWALRCLLGRGDTLSRPADIKVGHVTCSSQWHVNSVTMCQFQVEALGNTVHFCQLSLPLLWICCPTGAAPFT